MLKFIRISLCLALCWASAASAASQVAVFAGGCFWGVDAVYRHVRGVSEVVSGYTGGSAETAHYERVSRGDTGHAEAVRITFDPVQVSYRQLLHVFVSVAHDPTQRNRQGPDVGSQYRSAIFYANPEQQQMAIAYVGQLASSMPIATQVLPLQQFYPAETHHQNYLALHPDQPYIVTYDLPKLARLKRLFPELYR